MPGFERIDDLEKQAVIDVFDEGAVFFLEWDGDLHFCLLRQGGFEQHDII